MIKKHKNIKHEKEEEITLLKRTKEKDEIEEDIIIEKEDDRNCCEKLWDGYRGCIHGIYKCIYSVCVGVKNCLYNCCGCCCYPIKERFNTCCENVDQDLNPYKNPNYNPYDKL